MLKQNREYLREGYFLYAASGRVASVCPSADLFCAMISFSKVGLQLLYIFLSKYSVVIIVRREK